MVRIIKGDSRSLDYGSCDHFLKEGCIVLSSKIGTLVCRFLFYKKGLCSYTVDSWDPK